jgi:hypothetical protein
MLFDAGVRGRGPVDRCLENSACLKEAFLDHMKRKAQEVGDPNLAPEKTSTGPFHGLLSEKTIEQALEEAGYGSSESERRDLAQKIRESGRRAADLVEQDRAKPTGVVTEGDGSKAEVEPAQEEGQE